MHKTGKPDSRFQQVQETVFENAAVVLALVNENVEVININRTALDMLGKGKSDVLNRLGGEVFNCINAWSGGEVVCGQSEACRSCVLRNSVMDTFANGKTHYKREGFLDLDVDGETKRLRFLLTTAMVNLQGEKHALLTIEDVTELKDKESQLEQAIATRDKFFSIVSHDLRGPIGSMLALSNIIGNSDGGNSKEYFDIMHKELEHTSKLLENLLTWSRSQKGNIRLKPEILDVKTVVQDTLNLLGGTADKKHITIVDRVPPKTIAVADPNMLSTIFRNLISNAIKFTPNGGTITVSACQKSNDVECSVSDTGVGIPQKLLTGLFDLKVNPSSHGTAGEKGTGFGLVLCKEFVEKNGGEIRVESEEGTGTSVYFTLPC